MDDKNKFTIKTKVWIENNEGDVVFGEGRLLILNAIHKHGSINKAAKELKMSYRAVWDKIKTTEERLEKQLLIRNAGGASGGGSKLTPTALEIIKQFKILEKKTNEGSQNFMIRTKLIDTLIG
ncbi:MAG: LysR family transcriptional regulator [Desulfobacterales bacterium]|nr:LysR family transcriptional regulator [Desulfobacterales bacterium]